MHEVLTIAEIEKRFDGEWVLVGDPDLTDMNEVKSALVNPDNAPARTTIEAKLDRRSIRGQMTLVAAI